MKNNYPIKYAIYPVVEKTGYNHGINSLENKSEIIGYIPCKCFVVSEQKEYLVNGLEKIVYNIVFPFKKGNSFDYIRTEPQYDYYHDVINAVKTNHVFNDFQDAKKYATKLNNDIVMNKITLSSNINAKNYNEIVSKKFKKHEQLMANYYLLAEKMEQKTTDLVVNKRIKDKGIIVIKKDITHYKESIYKYIQYNAQEKFVVYSITKKIFDMLLIDRQMNMPIVENVGQILLINDGESNKIQLINPQDENECNYIECGKLFLNMSEEQASFERDNKKTIIYTEETYEDFIKSYLINSNIESEITLKKSKIAKRILL